MNFDFWMKASPRRKRILSTVAVLVVALVVTVAGSFMPIDAQRAEQINDELNQTVDSLSANGALMQYIFGNNFFICLLMFVPVVGPLLGCYALFNTGTVVGAIAVAEGYPLIIAFVALFLTPVAWLEFAAYSVSMGESVWLFRRILQGRFKHEFRNACFFVTVCAVLLLVGAVIETALLSIGV
ncbi:MAG: stage II sporulation protein M [Candidatus Bathyarchaeota archaeon]|nr:stage II sporulation protein M [Candidatus Bathyarchaeota archaeon]